MSKRFVKVYPRFERLWHWTQVLLIFVLMFTGLRVSGVHALIPFGPAVMLHTIAALTLLVVWIFATFWLFTTGTWRQFLPKVEGMLATARYYAYGIFKGEEPPYQKQMLRKHNPLQAATYFGLKWFVFPAIWVSGIIYLTYNFWDSGSDSTFVLEVVRNIHLLAAYVIFAFVIVHVYLLTTGHGFREHVKPMVTGYDCIELTPEQEAYLETNEPGRLKPVTPAE
ncbi:cytochrome b/b6 domain-containing protein [Celeribacter persicus]|jgi:Ni,Fe-hydrogenase I cytochrome b subunit|uniref:Ni,Fe-hydrogenase I cytochrome b subunit n=1 Tax=Celeribacter persicus TaxID=1651082 RepID=A0A2T5H900_9RHOB|nr:cytochrome b/b6 domain-containing protein [Celeribacter persicus]PTQ68044.1 Ni,Fe-hydrogenase I cytochrome b subunit [Celeribacter persicus]